MSTEGERLATVEAVLHELREDMTEARNEQRRTRGRLHDLEGLASMLVNQERQRARDTRENQARTHRRLELLTLVLLLTSVLDPFIYHALVGG